MAFDIGMDGNVCRADRIFVSGFLLPTIYGMDRFLLPCWSGIHRTYRLSLSRKDL